ncbi:unnamed protein product [Cylicostephanus goldi]|uniref:Uncharacterized protein n=1 Tax=Cylicostephanus goldi TaxID=71465 RepID=A0A3P6QJ51_CYLGO|nr:unnamed protein product [Cylicostephanus goldi]
MAAASEFMLSGSGEDAGSSRAETPQPATRFVANQQGPQKKRARREKRKRGGRVSGNESTSSVEKGTRNGPGKERAPKRTLAAELNEERRRREDEYMRTNTGGLGDWPMPDLNLGSLIEADERAQGSRLWPPTPIGSRASLTSQWSEHLQNSDPSASANVENVSYDPMSLGLSLGTTVAPVDHTAPFSIFAGADFSLWSSAATGESYTSWSNDSEKSASEKK